MQKATFTKAFLAVTGAAAVLAIQPAAAQAPKGTWARGDGKARVVIRPCGDNICAVNTWIKNPKTQDEKVGDRLVLKVKPVQAGLYKGTAYDPQRNLNMKFQMKVNGNRMTTSGCVLGGLLCKSMAWRRAK